MTIFSKEPLGDDTRIPFAATLLSVAGLLPIIALSLLIASYPLATPATGRLILSALISYCAVILAFLGGIRWGAALTESNRAAQAFALAMSVIPSVIGWTSLLFYAYRGQGLAPLTLLAAGFVTQALWDLVGAQRGILPRWFAKLRAPLTIIVVTCLVGTALTLPQDLR
jgi:hypothetical protein